MRESRERGAIEFAASRVGQLIHEDDLSRTLVRRELRSDVRLQSGARHGGLARNDCSDDDLSL